MKTTEDIIFSKYTVWHHVIIFVNNDDIYY